MNYESMKIIEVVQYINLELSKNRTMKDIEENDFQVNRGVIAKRLNRKGYRKIDNKFIFVNTFKDTTLNTTKIIQNKKQNTTDHTTNKLQNKIRDNQYFINFSNEELLKLKKIIELDFDKLKELLEQNTTANIIKNSIKDKTTKVTSIRLNRELYKKLKTYAKKNNIQLVDIFEEMMVHYLSDKKLK